jgi:hypothetical protein
MKKYTLHYILIAISIISCSKNETNNDSDTFNNILPPNTVTKTSSIFSSRSEKYSSINETTGLVVNQNNFLRYITQAEAQSLDFGNQPRYRFNLRDGITHDFNGDGRLDLFGFSTRFELFPAAGDLGRNPGKFFIISDFFSGNREMKIFDTDLCFIAGSFNLNDINKDGKKEVIIFNSNAHQNTLYGINNPLIPTRIYTIDSSFNLSFKNVGPVLNVHSGSSGDVDNDGDVDIVIWPLNLGRGIEPESLRYPYILINDGVGNFTTKNLLSNYVDFKSKYYDWSATVYELFDLNNDGNLDIIFGYNFGNYTKQPDPWNPSFDVVNKKIGVMWGNGSGQFDYKNINYLTLNDFNNYWLTLSGVGFTDFDKDGDVDIVIQSTTVEINYSKTYIMFLMENKGNKLFEDVTNLYLNGNFELNNTNYTHFYQPMFIDKDGDGDFDLIPNNSTAAWESFKVINNLFWEKQGKNFTRREHNN